MLLSRASAVPAPKPGGVVRLVAPASPFDRGLFDQGVQQLERWGHEVRFRDDIFDRWRYLAGTPERRAAELHEAFGDPDAGAVLAVRGGYGVTTALDLLDPELLRAHPKVLVGCSDLCALLNWAHQEADLVAFHGPMLVSLGRGADPQGSAALRALLDGEPLPRVHRSAEQHPEGWCLSPGKARGRLVGGSLSLIAATCGTPWQVDTRDHILLLEDVGERPYSIDRLLCQVAQAGLFDQAAAVILGDFTRCEEPGGAVTWRDAVERVLRPLPLPILAGLPFGHGVPNLPLPIGGLAEVDAGAGTLRLLGDPVLA